MIVFWTSVGLGVVLVATSLLLLSPSQLSFLLMATNVDRESWQEFGTDYHQRFGGYPPQSLEAWLRYARFHRCNERDFYDVIDHDLMPFRQRGQRPKLLFQNHHQNHQDMIISSGKRQTDYYIAFHLEQHTLTVVASRDIHNNPQHHALIETNLRWLLQPVVAHSVPEPLNTTLFFNLHDAPTNTQTNDDDNNEFLVPTFSFCKMSYMTDNQPPRSLSLSPDHVDNNYNYTNDCWRYQPYHPDHPDSVDSSQTNLLVPYIFDLGTLFDDSYFDDFQNRKDAIVWRGSTTGLPWGKSPRFQLMLEYGRGGGTTNQQQADVVDQHQHQHEHLSFISPEVPVLADFAFVRIVQQPDETTTLPPGTRVLTSPMDFAKYKHYKYILDIDGNAFTSRFKRLLRTGAVVLKSTRYREWYSERLQPYVDYVPVNYNLSDLVDKVAWLQSHPNVAHQIANHGKRTARTQLRNVDLQCYTYRLILEYHHFLFDE